MLLGGGLISLSKFHLGDECKRSLRSSMDELMGASSINSSALGNSSSTFLIAYFLRRQPSPESRMHRTRISTSGSGQTARRVKGQSPG
jgi:hypothetical protein